MAASRKAVALIPLALHALLCLVDVGVLANTTYTTLTTTNASTLPTPITTSDNNNNNTIVTTTTPTTASSYGGAALHPNTSTTTITATTNYYDHHLQHTESQPPSNTGLLRVRPAIEFYNSSNSNSNNNTNNNNSNSNNYNANSLPATGVPAYYDYNHYNTNNDYDSDKEEKEEEEGEANNNNDDNVDVEEEGKREREEEEDLVVLNDRVTLFNELKPQVISVDKYASVLIYCVGFPGNVLSFLVWVQKRMRHSSGCYLAALALDDFLFLTLHVVLELHMVWGLRPLNYPVICQVFPILFLAAQYMGPLLVLGFTTERYIAICHPFTREKYCTVRRAKAVIATLTATALGLSGVQGYFYTMQNSLALNGTVECGPRPQVSINGNTSLLILWNLSIEILTFLLVPLTVLVLNILVICEMRRLSRTEQVTLHGHSQRTSATTVMLLAVSFYLILTTLPVTIAYTLFYEFDYDFTRHDNYNATLRDPLFQRWMNYELVLASIKEFGTTQYAFNIIFYIITGKIFRKELKQLFSRLLCGKISLCVYRRYTNLQGSLRRKGSRSHATGAGASNSGWMSVNGCQTTTTTASEKQPDTETIL